MWSNYLLIFILILFIDFLTSGLSFVKNYWGRILWCLGGLLCFIFICQVIWGIFEIFVLSAKLIWSYFYFRLIYHFWLGGFLGLSWEKIVDLCVIR